MKKIIAMVLVFVFCLSFTACEDKEKNISPPTTPTTTPNYSYASSTEDCKKYLKQIYEIEIPPKSTVMYFSNESNFVAKIAVDEVEFDSFLKELQNNFNHSELLSNKINRLSTLYKNWDLKEEDVFGLYYQFYTATMPNGAKCSKEKSIYISKPIQGVYLCYFVK